MAIDMDHRTLAGLLVEDGQHFETPTADRFIVDKIPAPNMAGMFGFCLQAGGDTPASASWLALGDRQAQFTSQTLHASNTGPGPQVSLPLAACAQGLQFFFEGLLQDFYPQHLVCQHPF